MKNHITKKAMLLFTLTLLTAGMAFPQTYRFTVEGESFYDQPLTEFHSDFNSSLGGSLAVGRWIGDQLRVTVGLGYVSYTSDVYRLEQKQLSFYKTIEVIPLKIRSFVYFSSTRIRPFGSFGFGRSYFRMASHSELSGQNQTTPTKTVHAYNLDLGAGVEWKLSERLYLLSSFRYERTFAEGKKSEYKTGSGGFSAVWLNSSNEFEYRYDMQSAQLKLGLVFNLLK